MAVTRDLDALAICPEAEAVDSLRGLDGISTSTVRDKDLLLPSGVLLNEPSGRMAESDAAVEAGSTAVFRG